MKLFWTIIMVGLTLNVMAQVSDSVTTKKNSLKAVEIEEERKAKEREAERKRQQVLSDKSISFDRSELQSDLSAIERPVFTPGEVMVSDETVQTANGSKKGFKLIIPEVDFDKVKKDWYKTMKKASPTGVAENGNSYSAYTASMKKIAEEPLDLVVDFITENDRVLIHTVFEKDSATIGLDNYPKIYASVKSYLKEYGVDTYKDKVKDDVKTEKKKLKDLKKEQDNLIKKNEKEHKKISDNKILIDAAEDELQLIDGERKRTLENIQNKRNRVNQVSGKDAIKAAKQDVKAAEKEKKGIDTKRKKIYRDIVGYKGNIEKANQMIDLNLQKQKEQTLLVYKQELKIDALDDKLMKIK